MRTNLFRGVLVAAVAIVFAAPAFAQAIIKGTVVDPQGKPVANAVVLFEAVGGDRKSDTKTNGRGEFQQVGLRAGDYNVTATSGKLVQFVRISVKQGDNPAIALKLGVGESEEDKKARAAVGAMANDAIAALQAGNDDLAITKFEEVIAKVPTCSDCYYNLGLAYTKKSNYEKAEASFKKTIEIKPTHAEAYSGLANVYNAQKKFDEAVQMSAKAAEIATAAGSGGLNAEQLYNQGVTLWNAQKYAEAKALFDDAVKLDPKMSLAWYQLGMANLNLGAIPEAKTAFQGYLTADPSGPKAAEVQTFLKQLP